MKKAKKSICRFISYHFTSWAHTTFKKAKKFGKVFVGLSLDKEVKKYKGYIPELSYSQRKR